MKKTALLFLPLLLAISLNSDAHCQNLYYWNGSDSLSLTICSTYVSVKPTDPEFSAWAILLGGALDSDTAFVPDYLANGFWSLPLAEPVNHDSLLTALRDHEDVLFAHPAYFTLDRDTFLVTSTLYAKVKPGTTAGQIDSLVDEFNLTIKYQHEDARRPIIFQITADSPLDLVGITNDLYESGLFEYACPSFAGMLHYDSDPYFQYQWQYHNTQQYGGVAGADIDLLAAREYTVPNNPVLVALLDDGFELHEDVPASRWANGYDYVDLDWDESPEGNSGHGMLCLGSFAAVTDNSTGIGGIAPSGIRVLGQRVNIDDPATVTSAIYDAVDSNAAVIGISWSEYSDPTEADTGVTDALQYAYSEGVLNVCSAGNAGWNRVNFPASLDETIAVGASNHHDEKTFYSHYGNKLDLLAPSGDRLGYAVRFWTTDRMGTAGANDGSADCESGDPDYYCWFFGTSASSPEVSGIASLIMSRRPDLIGQPDVVRDILRYSCERTQYGSDPGDTSWVHIFYGWGRANAARALLAVSRGDANNDGTANISDAIYLSAWIFSGGPAPQPVVGTGDANCDGRSNISDAVYIITYIFGGGDAPLICYEYDD